MLTAWWVIGAIGSAFLSAWLADQKGRGGIWFLWGLLFGPLALLALIGAPPKVE